MDGVVMKQICSCPTVTYDIGQVVHTQYNLVLAEGQWYTPSGRRTPATRTRDKLSRSRMKIMNVLGTEKNYIQQRPNILISDHFRDFCATSTLRSEVILRLSANASK